jgi:hypothetical protein
MKILLVVMSLSTIVVFGERARSPKSCDAPKVTTPCCRLVLTNGVYRVFFADSEFKLTGDPHRDLNEPFGEQMP